jgi:mannose-6-phosphate isomerase-like protein (cupin superfamily)
MRRFRLRGRDRRGTLMVEQRMSAMNDLAAPTTFMDRATHVNRAVVVPLDAAASFWQPVPANGFVRCILNSVELGCETPFSMGTQTVAPGCFVREHEHDRHDEIIHVLAGGFTGTFDGVETPMPVGTTVFLPRGQRHKFTNPGPGEATFLWMLMPGGLDRFFAAIGRPREPGAASPTPFPRPDNVAEIERRTVFGWADQTHAKP